MISGVIFDMDGVLVDSEAFIARAAEAMFKEKNLDVKLDDFLPFVGTGEDRFIGGVAEKYNFPIDIQECKKRSYEIYAEIVKGELKTLPGVMDFIGICRKRNLKMALASSADDFKVRVNLDATSIPENSFDVIVCGSDVKNKKPSPDIFMEAASRLGVQPEKCLVVEDAVSGVSAAISAECRCLALSTSFSRNDLRKADWIANDLSTAPSDCLEW